MRDPFLLIFIIPAAALLWYARKITPPAGVRFSSGELLSGLQGSFKVWASEKIYLLRILAVIFIIAALARPQLPSAHTKIETEGVDIVLALDSSTSMLAEDFKIGNRRENRIEVVKDVVRDFIKGRNSDRIGMVSFAARAYTVCPLTLDYNWLFSNIERIHAGMIEDGTAIGAGIAAALNRLKNSRAKSKVVILLTDGRNNAGKISPLIAAEAAAALKIKVYTIGAGSKGLVPYPMRDLFGNKVYQQVEVDLDEETLGKIAAITGAQYFRATDTESLKNIYKEIDKLEKTSVEQTGYLEYRELFPFFLIPGLLLVVLEIVLTNTFLRKVP